jgi:phosphate acyltransferase
MSAVIKPVIAVDAMGGVGPEVTVPATCEFLESYPDASVILVGDKNIITAHLQKTKSAIRERISITHTDVMVSDNDSPSHALRHKKKSSMRLAINCVRDNYAHACVSSGNTGALMATAHFVLKMIPGIQRPAILTYLPTYDKDQGFRMLDLGANVDVPAESLVQFAIMGSVIASAVDNIEAPRVALLNIGEESHKGNAVIKQAADLLSTMQDINYIGYIEPNRIYHGSADVVVCDGFLGNISLKSIEGTARLVKHFVESAYRATWYSKLMALLSKPVIDRMKHNMSTSKRNGASMVGLNGIVVKSHGNANIKGFAYAIKNAYDESTLAIPEQIASKASSFIVEREKV